MKPLVKAIKLSIYNKVAVAACFGRYTKCERILDSISLKLCQLRQTARSENLSRRPARRRAPWITFIQLLGRRNFAGEALLISRQA